MAVANLKRDTDIMVAADTAHLNEIANDSTLISDRDETSATVRSQLVDFREGADTVYGGNLVRDIGFKGETPKDPLAVLSLARLVHDNIASDRMTVPSPKKPGLAMDLNAWTQPLNDGIQTLAAGSATTSGMPIRPW